MDRAATPSKIFLRVFGGTLGATSVSILPSSRSSPKLPGKSCDRRTKSEYGRFKLARLEDADAYENRMRKLMRFWARWRLLWASMEDRPSMTLGTCTSEMVWIRLPGGLEIQVELWPCSARGIRGSREQRPALDNLLSVCRKSSPRLQADFVVGRRNSITLPLCSGETHFTVFKNLVGM